jgi:hypothetical protein
MLVLGRQGAQDRQQPRLSLAEARLFFRIGAGIEMELRQTAGHPEHVAASFISRHSFQGKVVNYPEKPAAQVVASAPLPQMLKERKKRFLDNLLAVGAGQTDGERVAKKWGPKLVEQGDDLFFVFRTSDSVLPAFRRRESQLYCRVGEIRCHSWLFPTMVNSCCERFVQPFLVEKNISLRRTSRPHD